MEANKVSEKDERVTSQRLFQSDGSDQAPPLCTTVPCQSAFTQLDDLEYSCVETITGTSVSITSIIQHEINGAGQQHALLVGRENKQKPIPNQYYSKSDYYDFPCLAAKNYLAHSRT